MPHNHPALETIEIQTTESVSASVIWLHGLGADGQDFEPIVPELRLPASCGGVRFIFPHAPVRPITINGGMQMRGWYDLYSIDFNSDQDRAGIQQSVEQLEALIEQERQRGIADERVLLAGFSQGGAIALYAGLHHLKPLGGIMVLSSYLPLHDALERAHSNVPIFMAHGQQDSVIPISVAERSHQQLLAHQISPEWHSYPMGHSLCAEELGDIRHWLIERLHCD